ncbi:uncharacterized protein TrAtP1_012222 [Trichoderma atroviride]|uniref:uncharacterized protein n=1 Tax=Hypocrea atroviridis TaxID=63577 RepID=UPI0033317BA4|nr:hypothetical protein TrAtP1_012222 [Trichoderma atroviride]
MQPRTLQPCCPQEAPARYLQQYLALHPLGGIATRRRAALEPIRLKQFLLCCSVVSSFSVPCQKTSHTPLFCVSHPQSLVPRSLAAQSPSLISSPSFPFVVVLLPFAIHRHPAHSTNSRQATWFPPFIDFSTPSAARFARQRRSVENSGVFHDLNDPRGLGRFSPRFLLFTLVRKLAKNQAPHDPTRLRSPR